jgi:outer membrane receptor protein involved in Fe transport
MQRSRKRKLRKMQHARSALKTMPLASLIVAMSQAQAQDAQQEESRTQGVEEIIVSAQKRLESMQDVPVSIQAIGTQRLDELQVTDFEDYAQLLPSVSFQSGFGPGFAKVYFRGVASGGDGNHSTSLPSVGMYLDEQPVTTIQGNLDIHVYDIARIEALAGPQGTLYGASSQAGTVRIITNKPDPSGFDGAYNLEGNTVADGDPGYVAEGFVNVPIGESAAIRLVGWTEHEGGYIDNVPGTRTYPTSGVCISNTDPPAPGCVTSPATVEDNYNDIDTTGARAALRIDLNDSWTVTPTVMGQRQEANGFFGYDPNVGDLAVSHFYPEKIEDTWAQAALTVEGRIGNFDLVYAGAYLDRDTDAFTDYVDYTYYYDVCCGYGVYFYDNAGEFINPSQYIEGKDRYEKQSHEFRITSPQDRRLRYIAGLFWQRQVHDIEQRYKIDNLADAIEVTGWDDTWWLTEQIRTDRDRAIFGEVTFDFTDKLSGTGGLRFFEYENSLAGYFGFGLNNSFGSSTGEVSCFSDDMLNGGPCKNLDKTTKDSDSIHRLNLSYRFDDDRMMYATWSRGFRPGGVNRSLTLPPYKADFLTNYEVGWKTTWFDGLFRLNGAVFFEDWEDFQFVFLGPNALPLIANAANAEITGLEADFEWAATANFRLGGSFALMNAELSENYCGELDVEGNPVTVCDEPLAPKGTRLPVTPDFKGNVTGRYEFNIGQFDAHVQGAVIYVGDRSAELRTVQSNILEEVEDYTTLDLTAGLDTDRYQIELYIRNVTDERGELDHFALCDATVCGLVSHYLAVVEPRTIGLRFGQRF